MPVPAPNEAIKIVASSVEKISLLITDVVMPEMNIRELTQRLRIICPVLKHSTCPVILQEGAFSYQNNYQKKRAVC